MSAAKLDAVCARGPWTVAGEHWSDPPRTLTGADLRAYYDWIRSLRDQAVRAGVAFFLKQANIDGKLVHAPELDGRTWEEVPDAER